MFDWQADELTLNEYSGYRSLGWNGAAEEYAALFVRLNTTRRGSTIVGFPESVICGKGGHQRSVSPAIL
jgi:hypothetical protein